MFMMQWDDEIFDREGALGLFDAIGCRMFLAARLSGSGENH
jgi:hypothetical protein